MICPKCGTANPAEAIFCANCGQGLAVEPAEPAESSPQSTPSETASETSVLSTHGGYQPEPFVEPKIISSADEPKISPVQTETEAEPTLTVPESAGQLIEQAEVTELQNQPLAGNEPSFIECIEQELRAETGMEDSKDNYHNPYQPPELPEPEIDQSTQVTVHASRHARQIPSDIAGHCFAGSIPFGLYAFTQRSWGWGIFGFVSMFFLVIPLIGVLLCLIYPLYIVFQGRRIAWQSGRYKSKSDFKRSMEIWDGWGMAFYVINSMLCAANLMVFLDMVQGK